MTLGFDVSGTDAWVAVEDALKEDDDTAQAKALHALRDVAQSIVEAAKRAVLAEPVHSQFHSGLRAAIARNTGATNSPDGVEISSSLDGQRSNLPADMDDGSWWHPVFGNRHEWVREAGFYGWFSDAMDIHEGDAQNELEKVMDELVEHVRAA